MNENIRLVLLHFSPNLTEAETFPLMHQLLWGITGMDNGRELSHFGYHLTHDQNVFKSSPFLNNPETLKLAWFNSLIFGSGEYGNAFMNYRRDTYLSDAMALLPQNRCKVLLFLPKSEMEDYEHSYQISHSKALETLNGLNLPLLNRYDIGFEDSYDGDKVAAVGKLLSPKVRNISVNGNISPEHLYQLASSIRGEATRIHLSLYSIFIEVYLLLLPIVEAGLPFESPRITFWPNTEDLEPTYEKLRAAAATRAMLMNYNMD